MIWTAPPGSAPVAAGARAAAQANVKKRGGNGGCVDGGFVAQHFRGFQRLRHIGRIGIGMVDEGVIGFLHLVVLAEF